MLRPERKRLIDTTVAHLRSTLPVRKAPVDDATLATSYEKQDYLAMLRFVQRSLGLHELQVTLRIVHKGGEKAPAWVYLMEPFPSFHSLEFKALRVPVYVREDFLRRSGFEPTVIALAHELAHIVLECTGNARRKSEEAVDLTAMLLGYRDFYITGLRYRMHTDFGRARSPVDAYLLDAKNDKRWNAGYLSFDEVQYAARLMVE